MGVQTITWAGATREIMVAENIHDISLETVSVPWETTVLKLRSPEVVPVRVHIFTRNITHVIDSMMPSWSVLSRMSQGVINLTTPLTCLD